MSCEHGNKYLYSTYSDAGEITECMACTLNDEIKHSLWLTKKLFKMEDALRKFANLDNWMWKTEYDSHGGIHYKYTWFDEDPMVLAESALEDE